MIYLDKNENSILQPRINAAQQPLYRYSFEQNDILHAALVRHFAATACAAESLNEGNFILGAGSSDVMFMAFNALDQLARREGKKLRIFAQWPTFEVVLGYARALGAEVVYSYPLMSEAPTAASAPATAAEQIAAVSAQADEYVNLHYFCNPNNPTGIAANADTIAALGQRAAAGDWVILDEAYAEFAPEHASLPLCSPRVLHVRTFSKAFGLAGARLGYGIANDDFMGLLAPFYNPDRINCTALFAAIDALADEGFLPRLQEQLAEQKARVCGWLEAHGVGFLPSAGNFVLHRITPAGAAASPRAMSFAYQSAPASCYQVFMHEQGVAVARRSEGLENYSRISIGNAAETSALLCAWDAAHTAGLI